MTTTALIWIGLGVVVIAGALLIIVLVGLNEASDPTQSKPEELTDLERKAVGEQRDDLPENV
ncbi:MAG: hypothetical protein R3C45_01695 [Phycisphaerales bacterium]